MAIAKWTSGRVASRIRLAMLCGLVVASQALAENASAPAPTIPLPAPPAKPLPVDFNGVWRIVAYDEVVRIEDGNPEFTDEALRRIRNFKEHYIEAEDTPAKFCYHVGMPWSMLTRARDYPTEIYQTADRVVLFHEGMDMYRHIRLDSKEMPEGYVHSQQGYSVAHWEGEDLVIETRGLTALAEVGEHHRSEQARVIERWHLLREPGKNDRWEIKLTMEDPVIFKKPAHGRQLMERAEPGTTVGGYNCPQSLWDDYVASIKESREHPAQPATRKVRARPK